MFISPDFDFVLSLLAKRLAGKSMTCQVRRSCSNKTDQHDLFCVEWVLRPYSINNGW